MNETANRIKIAVVTGAFSLYMANMAIVKSEAVSNELKIVLLVTGIFLAIWGAVEVFIDKAKLISFLYGIFFIVQFVMLLGVLN